MAAQDVKIRKFEREDFHGLHYLSNQLSVSVNVDMHSLENHIDLTYKDTNYLILVAELKNSLVGYVSAYFHNAIYANGKVVYIDEIVVAAEHRGNRIGSMLLRELERLAKVQNCILVSLASGGAKGFYEKSGYISKASYFKKYLK